MLIRAATAADRVAAVQTMVAAFATDPMLRWLAPSDADYARMAPAFFGCLFDLRVGGGGEVRVSDDLTAVSMWNPPGGNRLGAAAVEAAWARAVDAVLTAEQLARWPAFDEIMSALHPTTPHWYLGVAAVRPGRQGHGLGAAVIRALLAEPIAADAPAFLITSNPANVPIYERIGFAVLTRGQLPQGPSLWGMLRPLPQPELSMSV